jgi:hypothetical protein
VTFPGPFGTEGTFFGGGALDGTGGVATYAGGGFGYGAGVSLSAGATVSDAVNVTNLGGAFVNTNIGAGAGGSITVDTFVGRNDNGFVTGLGASVGFSFGGSLFSGPTNTVIAPLTRSPNAVDSPSDSPPDSSGDCLLY